jgi:hypothetical protein
MYFTRQCWACGCNFVQIHGWIQMLHRNILPPSSAVHSSYEQISFAVKGFMNNKERCYMTQTSKPTNVPFLPHTLYKWSV